MNNKVIISILSHDYGIGFSICPNCNILGEGLIDDDYVSHPMIWCDECGSQFIIDAPLEDYLDKYKIDNIKLNKENIKQLKKLLNDTTNNNDIEELKQSFYTFNLMYVKQLINNDLSYYYSNKLISQENINKFIDSNYDNNLRRELKIKKIKLEDIDPEFIINNTKYFNIAIDCESYNIHNPKNKYPYNFSLTHDGTYIYYKCIDTNNNTVFGYYGGD